MPIQINPSKIPIWTNSDELRLGLMAGDQVLKDLSNSQERLIDLLFKGVAADQLQLVGSSVGLTDIETTELVERLRPSLIKGNIAGDSTLDVRFAEIIRIGFQTDQAPGEVLANRAEWIIQIPVLDRTGLTLVRVLAEVGFKNFVTEDYSMISDEDCGELGFPRHNLGRARIDGVRELTKSNKDITIVYSNKTRKKLQQLKVLSASHQLLPSTYRDVKTQHLAIEYRLDSVFVSSVISPSQTPCLGCRDLWQQEQNSQWVVQGIQLTARRDQLDDGPNLLIAGAIAARNICNFIDDGETGDSIVVQLATRHHVKANWSAHPTCSCLRD